MAMKTKTLFLVILLSGFILSQISAQTLKKGAVVALHTYSFNLKPDVTQNQLIDFIINKYIPESEKNFPGTKLFLLSGDRGEKKNQIGFLEYFETVQARDKYFPAADKSSPEGDAASAKMEAVSNELMKYITDYTRIYTDWIIK
jgi:hypothetical protein